MIKSMDTALRYRSLSRDLNKALERTEKDKVVARELAYYREKMPTVSSLDAFLADTRLFKFAMKAYGLEDMDYAKGFMRKLLSEDINDSKSMVVRLKDENYRAFYRAFSYLAHADATPAYPSLTSEVSEGIAKAPAREGATTLMTSQTGQSANKSLLVKPASSAPVKSYSVMYDLFVPRGQTVSLGSLFQTNPSANAADDADLFLKFDATGFGVGVNGSYAAGGRYNSWNRIGFTVENSGGSTSTLKIFVNGTLAGTQSVDAARFTIPTGGFRVMADNDGEVGRTQLSSLLFSERALADAEMTGFGAADQSGISDAPIAGATQFDFSEGLKSTFGYATAEGSGVTLSTEATQAITALPSGADGSRRVFQSGGDGLLVQPQSATDLENYTLVYDLFVKKGDAISRNALLQTDPTNRSDAEVFLKDEGGSMAAGAPRGGSADYSGKISYDAWNRVAISVEKTAASTSTLKIFVNGELVSTQTVDSARYTLSRNGFSILRDDSGEAGKLALGSFALVNRTLSAGDIGALGGTTAGGIARSPIAGATQFDFDGTMAATYGTATVSQAGTKSSLVTRDFAGVSSPPRRSPASDKLLRLPASSARDPGLLVRPSSGTPVKTYTLVYDMFLASNSAVSEAGLFQTDLTNAGKAPISARTHEAGGFGVGAKAASGSARYDSWNRIAVTVEENSDGTTATLKTYINGEPAGTETVSMSAFTIGAGGFLIMAGPDGNSMRSALSSFAFAERAMTAGEIAALGMAKKNGVSQQAIAGATQFDFDGDFQASYGSATMTSRMSGARFEAAATSSLPSMIESAPTLLGAPATSPGRGGFRVQPKAEGDTKSYSLVYDLYVDGSKKSDLISLFQTDLANGTAGELLARLKGDVLQIGTGNKAEGSLAMNTWNRVAFTVENQGGTSRVKAFINGKLVSEQNVPAGTLTIGKDGFLIMSDGRSQSGASYLDSFAFVDRSLADHEVAGLGAARRGGIFSAGTEGVTQFGFNGSLNADFGSATMTWRDAASERSLSFDRTIRNYVRAQLESKAGADNEGVQMALYFQRKAQDIHGPYDILSDKTLWQVVRTALDMPDEVVFSSLDKQARLLDGRLKYEDFQDPQKLEKFIQRFTTIWSLVHEEGPTDPRLALFDTSEEGDENETTLRDYGMSDLLSKLQALRLGGR